MKSKCSFILKASISLVLALVLLFGTVATSLAAVVDELAETGDNEILNTYIYINMNSAGCTLNGIGTFTTVETSGNGSWIAVGSAKEVETGIYRFNINDTNKKTIRINTRISNGNWQDAYVHGDADASHNMITLDSGRTSGTWGTYYPKYYIRGANATATGVTNANLSWNIGVELNVKDDIRYVYLDVSNTCSFKIVSPDAWAAGGGTEYSTIDNNLGNVTLGGGGANNVTVTTDCYICFDTTQNKIYATTVSPVTTHNVSFTPSPTGGTVTVNDSSTSPVAVVEDDDYTIKAAPSTGYVLGSIEVDNITVSGASGSDDVGWTVTQNVGTADKTVTVTFTPKTSALTFNLNGGSGTAPTGKTASYGSAMPAYGQSAPTKDGYSFTGFYDAQTGGTQYYTDALASAKNWDKNTTSGTTLYAQWTKNMGGATIKAFTNDSASDTGGKVKVGSGTASGTVTVSDSTLSIEDSSDITAVKSDGYTFDGWQFSGDNWSHIKYSLDGGTTWDSPTAKDTTCGSSSNTTIKIRTDGTSGMTTSNTEVHAIFNPLQYTITGSAKYTDNGSTWTTDATGGSLTVSAATGDYSDTITLTATAESGYAVVGIYRTDGGTETRVETSETYTADKAYRTSETKTGYTLNDTDSSTYTFVAKFAKVRKVSAYKSYRLRTDQNGVETVIYDAAPPSRIVVEHLDGTTDTYTYKSDQYNTTPTLTREAGFAKNGTATYGVKAHKNETFDSGNYTTGTECALSLLAGDSVTMQYTALASSDTFAGVYYDNANNYYDPPTPAAYSSRVYTYGGNVGALYINRNYIPSSASTSSVSDYPATVNQITHSVGFTVKDKDYLKVSIELAEKPQIIINDSNKLNLTGYNLSGFYAAGETVNISIAPKTGNSVHTLGSTATFKNSDGDPIDDPGLTYTYDSTAKTATLTGTMPADIGNIYVDLGVATTYTLGVGSSCVSDMFYTSSARPNLTHEWKGKVLGGDANDTDFAVGTISVTPAGESTAVLSVDDTNNIATDDCADSGTVSEGTELTFEFAYNTVNGTDLSNIYHFVGWFAGDSEHPDQGPDLRKEPVSDSPIFTEKYSENTYLYAVAVRAFYIAGDKDIVGGDINWANVQPMDYNPDTGEYTWTINSLETSDTARPFKIFSQADMQRADFWWDTDTGKTIDDDGCSYSKASGNGSGSGSNSDTNASITYTDTNKGKGYGVPIVIHWKPSNTAAQRFWVTTTRITNNLYISDGYKSLSKIGNDQTSTIVSVNDGGTWKNADVATGYIGRSSDKWSPENEGHVSKFWTKKDSLTIKLSKAVDNTYKVAAFVVYNITDSTVEPLTDISFTTVTSTYKSTGTNGAYVKKSVITAREYSATYKLSPDKDYYIVPVIEYIFADENDKYGTNSNVQRIKIQFNGRQLNTSEWGTLVGCYAWYGNGSHKPNGNFPGQLMIPDSIGAKGVWTANLPLTTNNAELSGVLFTNYVNTSSNDTSDRKTWLDQNGVMGSGNIVKKYNEIVQRSDDNDYTYSNCKVQTYDYREPLSLYNANKNNGEELVLSFALKSGNSSQVLSSRHRELANASTNIFSGFTHTHSNNSTTSQYSFDRSANFEYLTDSTGNNYTDINGVILPDGDKPTPTFYVIAKGMVTYNKSDLLRVFYSGNNRDDVSDDTLYGVSGVSADFGVQWYVYDASGNYITTMLSAGYADRPTASSYSLIAQDLSDKGYAVDGKAVGICYDIPRACNNDQGMPNGGTSFRVYRMGGQWYVNTTNTPATVSVKVGVYSGGKYVPAETNAEAYGNATATYDYAKGKNYNESITKIDTVNNAYVTTTLRDADNQPVKVTASESGFIGWYQYDNDGNPVLFSKEQSFYPNFSGDLELYAFYKESAKYRVKYIGRDGSTKYYYKDAADLSVTEMRNGSKMIIDSARDTEVAELTTEIAKISVYNQDINVSLGTPNLTEKLIAQYDLTQAASTYTLTIYYPDSSGDTAIPHTPNDYKKVPVNEVVNFDDSLKAAVQSGAPSGQKFVGWYEYYANGNLGELLSTRLNYGYVITRDQSIIAVYGSNGYTGSGTWKSYVEDNQITHELYSSTTGTYYNDSLIHFRHDGPDSTTLVPDGYETGVFIAYRLDNTNGADVTVDSSKIQTYIDTMRQRKLTNAKSSTLGLGFAYIPTAVGSLSDLNRVILCLKSDYETMQGRKYAVYAYMYDGSSNYVLSAPAQGIYD